MWNNSGRRLADSNVDSLLSLIGWRNSGLWSSNRGAYSWDLNNLLDGLLWGWSNSLLNNWSLLSGSYLWLWSWSLLNSWGLSRWLSWSWSLIDNWSLSS